MKTLVVVYSRTGWTRRVGEEIGRECGAELRVIEDVNSRRGLFGYWRSIQDARKARHPAIKPMSLDLRPYDLVILGAPVWAGHMAAPVRTFIQRYKQELRRVAVFCTMGGAGADRALAEMGQALGRNPVARLALKDSEIKKGGREDSRFPRHRGRTRGSKRRTRRAPRGGAAARAAVNTSTEVARSTGRLSAALAKTTLNRKNNTRALFMRKPLRARCSQHPAGESLDEEPLESMLSELPEEVGWYLEHLDRSLQAEGRGLPTSIPRSGQPRKKF